jgi:hypothetical protein
MWRTAMNEIALLNDGLRRTFSRGKVVMTVEKDAEEACGARHIRG